MDPHEPEHATNTAQLPGLLLLQLLSDRKGQLVALQLSPVNHAGITAEPIELSTLAALTECLPCVFDETIDPEIGNLLSSAGARAIASSLLADPSAQPGDALPATVQWLAGRWYLQPPEESGKQPTASRALALKLMQLVAADADTRDIEDVFRCDPSLSYHLLRLVNSVAMGLSRTVSSFSQAIILVGRQQLRRWLNFILFAAHDGDIRSAMLFARVAVRARSLELLAKAAGFDRSRQDEAFMVGMFSLLGVLFGQPLAELLQPLRIHSDSLAALLAREGDLGLLLSTVEAAEHGNLPALEEGLGQLGLSPATFTHAHIEAHVWMRDVMSESGVAARG